jgi:hypothetical protein
MGGLIIEAAKADSRGLRPDDVDLILPVTYAERKLTAQFDLALTWRLAQRQIMNCILCRTSITSEGICRNRPPPRSKNTLNNPYEWPLSQLLLWPTSRNINHT